MADGEINVNVRADGVDEAAEDVADEGGMGLGGGDGGGDGGRGSGLAQSIKGGIVGGLVATLLGPLLEVFDPFVQVLQAFVAPLAQMLLRLFTPILRILIGLLPVWFDFLDENEGLLMTLLAALFPLATYLPSIVNAIQNIDFSDLPRKIGVAIAERLPGLSPETTREDPGPVTSGTSEEVEEQTAANRPISIAISGGLTPFIDLITADRNVDFGVR